MLIDNQFNSINEKLQLLLKGMNRLRKENEKLKGELEAAKERELVAYQKIDELQQQTAILKLATDKMSDRDKKDFERQINQYIKEIDKCIAFLSQ